MRREVSGGYKRDDLNSEIVLCLFGVFFGPKRVFTDSVWVVKFSAIFHPSLERVF